MEFRDSDHIQQSTMDHWPACWLANHFCNFLALLSLENYRGVWFRTHYMIVSVGLVFFFFFFTFLLFRVLNRTVAFRNTHLFPFSSSLTCLIWAMSSVPISASIKKKAQTFSPWPDVAFINARPEIFTSKSCSDRPQMCPVSSDEAEHGKIIMMEKLGSRAAFPTSILLFFLLVIIPFYCAFCSDCPVYQKPAVVFTTLSCPAMPENLL